jgi:hypothetical protein
MHLYNEWNESNLFYNFDTCVIVITFVVLVWKKENVSQENIYICTYYMPVFLISLIQIDFVCVHV